MIRGSDKKIGLALGGGAARGVAHIGALKAFSEIGIEFDYIAGTSIGSLIGAGYANRMSWSEMLEVAHKFDVRDLMKWRKWNIGYDSQTIEDLVVKLLGQKNINELSIPFSAVSVDLRSGQEIIIQEGSVAKAIRASCSIPGVFSAVEIENMILVDGGVLNNVPAKVVRRMGADIVIAVNLTAGVYDNNNTYNFFEVLYTSFNIMVHNNSLLGRRYADLVIEPDLNRVPFHVMKNIDEVAEKGAKAVYKALPELERILMQN